MLKDIEHSALGTTGNVGAAAASTPSSNTLAVGGGGGGGGMRRCERGRVPSDSSSGVSDDTLSSGRLEAKLLYYNQVLSVTHPLKD